MPKHRIQIGNKILESSKDIPWSIILESAELLKKFARWNPDEKKWIINWRFLPHLSLVLEFIDKISQYDEIYGIKLSEIIREILANIPAEKISDNMLLVAPIDFDPFDIIKSQDFEFLKSRLKKEKISLADIGDIEVPYLAFPIPIILKEIQAGHMEKFPDILKDALAKIEVKKLQPMAKTYPLNARKIVVEVPSYYPKQLIDELLSLGEITIFYEDASGKLSEKTFNLSYIKTLSDGTKRIILPSYAIGLIERIFTRYKARIQIDYGIPLDEIDLMRPNLQLMKHQQEALESWLMNGKRGTIVIPTGGGKTHVALAAMARLKLPTIVFVPNTWLLDQWVTRISQFLGIPKGLIGVLGGGKRQIRSITVSTYQSAYRYIEDLTDKFAFAVFDEAHHVPARTFKDVALNLRAIYRMALSATPKRRDGNEVLLFKLVGGIVYNISYRELVLRGIVAPVAVRKYLVSLPPDRILIYRQYERKTNSIRDEFEKRKYLNKMIEIARDNPAKLEVIRHIIIKHKSEKIFVFAGSIKFAELIEKEIKDLLPTALLTSKTDSVREERIIRAFQRGAIRCLILVKKGEEGVDVGDASVAIIAGGSKQEREIIQRVGRILRGGKDKLAWLYEIVTRNTVEELLSKSRNTRKIVAGIEDYVKSKYNVSAYEVIKWK